jgi:hypothetical protein
MWHWGYYSLGENWTALFIAVKHAVVGTATGRTLSAIYVLNVAKKPSFTACFVPTGANINMI